MCATALRLGFAAADVVYDSPCKTVAEIHFALQSGVHLNVDNLLELERVRTVRAELPPAVAARAVIGLRVNTLVGAGKVSSLSVSTRKSKFGVLLPPEAGDERSVIVDALAAADFVNSIHVHTGSGGMSVTQMAEGAGCAAQLAAEVNARRAAVGLQLIDVIDVGGGYALMLR